ncbi:tRNA (adenosine(37)-N6)-dimethylallyltransferase MiaA [Niabella ginsengisoli]|uniref:tRNA dimethylallyltransferase n=1 Tax=Niabella ginsengisoli TaxID=522298 RepID=A0ABS9SMK9_9BACT|nr:tRNA (adenosine(37)-N6)-dimethylallyltransferase MiaA [Niabella ginsengisoli]MCH5599589.1 tRNA (adenosine(37)-N6)-dimethylallyltransferase MiaA [Niabella ginsengisoli]
MATHINVAKKKQRIIINKLSISNQKTLLVIAGPTAVGKTAHAIEVARHFKTVILSADSRQCYKELNIGVARPSVQELNEVPHYFIASHSIHDDINAAWYEAYALNLLKQLFNEHDLIVVTGGTGLYIKALVEGLDVIPAVDDKIRQHVIDNYNANGLNWLQQQLQFHDPLFSAEGEMQNPQRMMRALEVALASGQSILTFRKKPKDPRAFNILQVGLELPRPILNERINARVEMMMRSGLESEARQLLPHRHLNALQTVGYKEIFEYLDSNVTLNEAEEQIKQNTRRYAKRQMTWFKRQPNMHWINLQEEKEITPHILSLRNYGQIT